MSRPTQAAFIFLLFLIIPLPLLAQDADLDGMPDSYEAVNVCLNPAVNDAAVDYDVDSLTNLQEYQYSPDLNPCVGDSDGDFVNDGAEVASGSNPLDREITPGLAKVWPEVQLSTTGIWMGRLIFTGSEYGLFWSSGYNIMFNRLDLDGNKLTADRVLNPIPDRFEMERDGIVWTGSEYGVLMLEQVIGPPHNYLLHFQRFSSDGTALGDGLTVADDSWLVSLVWTGSEFGMVYGTFEVQYFRRISAGGQLLSDTMLPFSPTGLDWTGSEFGVAGNDIDTMLFQRLTSDGRLLGAGGSLGTSWSGGAKVFWTGFDHRLIFDLQPGGPNLAVITLTGDSIGPGFSSTLTPVAFPGYLPDWDNASFNTVFNSFDYPQKATTTIFTGELNYLARVRLSRTYWFTDMAMGYWTLTDLAWTGSQYGVIWSQPGARHCSIFDPIPLYFARLAADSDGDGLTDADEVSVFLTNPADWDTDGDQIPDGYEQESPCLDPLVNDGALDGDTDGLSNIMEYLLYHTDECAADTDNAGEEDGHELAGGRDPLSPLDDLIIAPVGAGNQDWAWPLHTSNHDARTQTIYLGSDVGRAGEIASIGLYVTVPPGQALTNFLVRLRPTVLTAYPIQNPAWESAGWVECSAGSTVITTSGWHDFACAGRLYQSSTLINTAFMIDWSFDNATASADGAVRYFSPGGKRSLYLGANSTLGSPAAWAGASPAGTTSGRAPILQLYLEADDDNDTMIDNWEKMPEYGGIEVGCFNTLPGSTEAHPADMDGDGLLNYDEVRVYGTSPCQDDSDWDGANDGVDCDPLDPYNWISCATCVDLDGDGWHVGCDKYGYGNNGPDCDDANPNAWDSCATCLDLDADGRYTGCDAYVSVGQDCNDDEINAWDTCQTCLDRDLDGRYGVCNQYVTVLPDCNDEEWMTWDTCETCQDADHDGWFVGCNLFSDTATDVTGADTTAFSDPMAANYLYSRTQSVYRANKLVKGVITEVGLDVVTPPGQPLQNFTIRMKHTDLMYSPSSWDAPDSGWTTVYQANEAFSTVGWHALTLVTPFEYNGVQNLMVDISFANATTSTAGSISFTFNMDHTISAVTNAYPSPLSWTGSSSPTPVRSGRQPNLRLKIDRQQRGPDCDDLDGNSWINCGSCVDADEDSWQAGCDGYPSSGPVTVGQAVSQSYVSVFHASSEDARSQHIYRASDIGAAGTITALTLDVLVVPGQTLNNFTIRMKHTNIDASSFYFEGRDSGWTTVYQDVEPRGVTGLRTYTFSTPFVYNGKQNLMIDFSFNNSSSSTNGAVRNNATGSGTAGDSNSPDGDPLDWIGNENAGMILTGAPHIILDFEGPADGPDCDDANPNTWDTCATCLDDDSDNWWVGCNQFLTVSGPDCSDANPNAWNTCAACVDVDADTWYVGCNRYLTVNGPDCGDGDPFAWVSCGSCVDLDSDGWFGGCDRYQFLQSRLTGSGGILSQIYSNFQDWRLESIYPAALIGPAGAITALALDVTTVPGQILNNFTIRLKHTSMSSHTPAAWEGPGSGWTTVYQANEPPGIIGWHTFTFTTPFNYDGVSNLMVDFSFNNSSASTVGFVRVTGAGSGAAINGVSNGTYGDPLNWSGTSNPPSLRSSLFNLRLTTDFNRSGPDCDDDVLTGPTCHDTCATFYDDQDGDLFGDQALPSAPLCAPPAGYVADNTDCAPTIVTIHPGAAEVCNGIDDNCVGGIDDGLTFTEYFADLDGDDYGTGSLGSFCSTPADSALVSGDCNDGNVAVNPGATEVCNSIDDNCVDGIDEGGVCSPSTWDTDLDGIPDTYEIAHAADPLPLDYLNGADGLLDADTDGNPNVHEYWNGTDYRVKDPKGGEGCYYWGDATGDGFIGAVDITILTSRIKGPADYSRVIPNNGETQDLDDNGFWGAVDTTLLSAFAKSDSTTGIATRPSSIEKLSSATASVQVGNTTHVTVALRNLHSTYTVGFGVVFSIDPSSTGTAVILGGDGANGSGYRYDMTGAKSFSARSNVIILVKTAGTIKINAGIPQCGMIVDRGRYCEALSMTEPFIITGY